MKNENGHLLYLYKLILLTLFVIISISYSYSQDSKNNGSKTKMFKNEKFYFSIQLPNDWNTSEIPDLKSDLKLTSLSPNGHQTISLFVIESTNNIDLVKLADADSKIFKNLGPTIEKKTKRKYLIIIKGIEKSYLSQGQTTKLFFQVKNNFGYILMWKSIDKDNSTYLKVAHTFDINMPFSKTVLGWIGDIGGWIVGIIALFLIIGILFLIGITGQFLGRGINLKKELIKSKKESLRKGLVVNEKWHSLNRKSNFWITLPILGWSSLYVYLFNIFPAITFLILLLGLVPVIMGYFGILFGPSTDPDDYL